jgi:hypothetical protein
MFRFSSRITCWANGATVSRKMVINAAIIARFHLMVAIKMMDPQRPRLAASNVSKCESFLGAVLN